MKSFNTDIYLDGVTEEEIIATRDTKVKGYTFNPSLFRQLGVKDYLDHSIKLAKLANSKPISLEVIGDDPKTIINQALKLSQISDNVYVKLPITLTNGDYNSEIMKILSLENVKLNITAVFTIKQV